MEHENIITLKNIINKDEDVVENKKPNDEDSEELLMKKKTKKSQNSKTPKKLSNKNIKKEKKKKKLFSQSELIERQQIKTKNDIKNIFRSSQFINHNLKSLQKELKINDTIVAIISSIIILLSFIQVITLFLFKE